MIPRIMSDSIQVNIRRCYDDFFEKNSFSGFVLCITFGVMNSTTYAEDTTLTSEPTDGE